MSQRGKESGDKYAHPFLTPAPLGEYGSPRPPAVPCCPVNCATDADQCVRTSCDANPRQYVPIVDRPEMDAAQATHLVGLPIRVPADREPQPSDILVSTGGAWCIDNLTAQLHRDDWTVEKGAKACAGALLNSLTLGQCPPIAPPTPAATQAQRCAPTTRPVTETPAPAAVAQWQWAANDTVLSVCAVPTASGTANAGGSPAGVAADGCTVFTECGDMLCDGSMTGGVEHLVLAPEQEATLHADCFLQTQVRTVVTDADVQRYLTNLHLEAIPPATVRLGRGRYDGQFYTLLFEGTDDQTSDAAHADGVPLLLDASTSTTAFYGPSLTPLSSALALRRAGQAVRFVWNAERQAWIGDAVPGSRSCETPASPATSPAESPMPRAIVQIVPTCTRTRPADECTCLAGPDERVLDIRFQINLINPSATSGVCLQVYVGLRDAFLAHDGARCSPHPLTSLLSIDTHGLGRPNCRYNGLGDTQLYCDEGVNVPANSSTIVDVLLSSVELDGTVLNNARVAVYVVPECPTDSALGPTWTPCGATIATDVNTLPPADENTILLAEGVGCGSDVPAPRPLVYFVGATGLPSNDGLTWATAVDLVTGLALAGTAAPGTAELWVQRGIYLLSTPIRLPDGVRMFGGFNGTEVARCQRDPEPQTNGTILDGQNTVQVIRNPSIAPLLSPYTLVDGFTIRNGLGVQGGGILLGLCRSVTLRHLEIVDCRSTLDGGGIFLFDVSDTITTAPAVQLCDVRFRRCVAGQFADNVQIRGGGANLFSNRTAGIQMTWRVLQCVFESNRNQGGLSVGGGLVLGGSSTIQVRNSVFAGNQCETRTSTGQVLGAGLCILTARNDVLNQPTRIEFINNTVAANTGIDTVTGTRVLGAGLFLSWGSQAASGLNQMTVRNSIFWNNTATIPDTQEEIYFDPFGSPTSPFLIYDSLVRGGVPGLKVSFGVTAGSAIKSMDPLLVAPPANVHLQPTSPALSCGDNMAVACGGRTGDAQNAVRIQGGRVDLGAYEECSGI